MPTDDRPRVPFEEWIERQLLALADGGIRIQPLPNVDGFFAQWRVGWKVGEFLVWQPPLLPTLRAC